MEAGDEGVKVVDGIVRGQVGGGSVVDAGDDGVHLLFDGAVVGSDGLLVVLERDPKELVLELERFSELGEVRGRSGRGVSGAGNGGGGGVVAVGKGIHIHLQQTKGKTKSQIVVVISGDISPPVATKQNIFLFLFSKFFYQIIKSIFLK